MKIKFIKKGVFTISGQKSIENSIADVDDKEANDFFEKCWAVPAEYVIPAESIAEPDALSGFEEEDEDA